MAKKPELPKWKFHLVSLQREKVENFPGEPIRVLFRTKGRVPEIEFPILIAQDQFDEADLVRVAKAYMSRTFRALAQMTEEWDLPEDEFEKLRLPQKPTPR